MKANNLKALLALGTIALQLSYFSTVAEAKSKGGADGGGGDSYTLDFIKIANQEIYPWLAKNKAALNLKVDANEFLMAINPKDISSIDRVYESCDGSNKGREVEICYNYKTDKFFISRTRYKINDRSPSKKGVVAHEIFRKINIEGDDYEVTKKFTMDDEQNFNVSKYLQRYPDVLSSTIKVASNWGKVSTFGTSNKQLREEAELLLQKKLDVTSAAKLDINYKYENAEACSKLAVVKSEETNVYSEQKSKRVIKSGSSILLSMTDENRSFAQGFAKEDTINESFSSKYRYSYVKRDVLCVEFTTVSRAVLEVYLVASTINQELKENLVRRDIEKRIAESSAKLSNLTKVMNELIARPYLTVARTKRFFGDQANLSFLSWANEQLKFINSQKNFINFIQHEKMASEFEDSIMNFTTDLDSLVESLTELENGQLLVAKDGKTVKIFSKTQIEKLGNIGSGSIQNESLINSFYLQKETQGFLILLDDLALKGRGYKATYTTEYDPSVKIVNQYNLLNKKDPKFNDLFAYDHMLKNNFMMYAKKMCIIYRVQNGDYNYLICPTAETLDRFDTTEVVESF